MQEHVFIETGREGVSCGGVHRLSRPPRQPEREHPFEVSQANSISFPLQQQHGSSGTCLSFFPKASVVCVLVVVVPK